MVTTRTRRNAALVVILAAGWLVLNSSSAHAGEPGEVLAAESIEEVVNNLRTWLVRILFAVATFFFTYGAVRYLSAGGNTADAEKGKNALRSAAIGYGLALLAPLVIKTIGELVK